MTTLAASSRLTDAVTAYAGQTDFAAAFLLPPKATDGTYRGIYVVRRRAGVETWLQQPDFSIVNIVPQAGGGAFFTARLAVGAQAGDVIRVVGKMVEARETAFQYGGALRTERAEEEFTRQGMALQELRRDADRGFVAPLGEIGPVLPRAADRAGKILGFADDGVTPLTRSLSGFDADVEATASNRQEVESLHAEVVTLKEETQVLKDLSQELYNGIDPATAQAIADIADNYQQAADNLTAREVAGLAALDTTSAAALSEIETSRAASLGDIAANRAQAITDINAYAGAGVDDLQNQQAIAEAAIAANVEAAANSEAVALQTKADIIEFFENDTENLPARVAALENPLTISAFSATPNVAEVGSNPAITLNWTLSQNPVSQSINQGIGAVAPVTVRTFGAGNANADKSWILTVSNGFADRTATASVAFRRRRYYGVTTKAAGVALTNAEVLALTGEFDTDYLRAGLVFDCTGGRYPVVCWPAAWGVPTSITVGGLAFTAFTIEDQDVTNASGSLATYKILRFNDIQTGANIGVTF